MNDAAEPVDFLSIGRAAIGVGNIYGIADECDNDLLRLRAELICC